MSRSLIECQDLDWFAVDSLGQLALFASAGSIVIPEVYVSRIDFAMEVADLVNLLPCIGSHEIVTGQPSTWRNATWTAASERGLFGFDYDVEKEAGYALFTVPTVAVRFDSIAHAWIELLPYYSGTFSPETALISREMALSWKAKGSSNLVTGTSSMPA